MRRPELMVAMDEGVPLSESNDSGSTNILPGVYIPHERPAFFGELQVKRRLDVLKAESETALNSGL